MKKLGQKGFGVIEGVLILVIVGIIGGAGYFVYNRQSNNKESSTQKTPEPKYVETTDSAKTFSFSYPESWRINPYVWVSSGDEGGDALPEPDWTKKSKPITLQSVKDENVVIDIIVDSYGYYGKNQDDGKSYEDLLAYVKEDYFAKILFEGQREDGHRALFSRVDYLGPPDAKVESFTDHRYYFDNGKAVLRVEFREKYHHDWSDNGTGPDIDNTKYLSDFENIAKSIKFLN